MTLKQYLAVMLLGTLVSAMSLGILLTFVDPETTGMLAIFVFLASAGLTVTGVVATIGVLVRVFLLRRRELVEFSVRVSLRQGGFIALLFLLGLLLAHRGLLTWWNIALALFALSIAEYLFLSSDARHESAQEYEH